MRRLAPIVFLVPLLAACAGADPRPDEVPAATPPEATSSPAEAPTPGSVEALQAELARAMRLEDPAQRAEALATLRDKLPRETSARVFVSTLLVDAYGQTGDLERMQAAAREVPVEDTLETAQMLNGMAYAYAQAGEHLTEGWVRVEQALEILGRLTESLPPERQEEPVVRQVRAAFLDTLGWIQFRMGEHDEALETLDTALAQADDWEIRYHRGRVFEALGRGREAAMDYARAVVRGGEEAREARDALEAMPEVDADALIDRTRQMLDRPANPA